MSIPTSSNSSVSIQIEPSSVPSIPLWFGELAAFEHRLTSTGILNKIQEQVRFARVRFGTYDLIDFAVVLIGYVHAARTNASRLLRAVGSVRWSLYGPLWPQPLASSQGACPGFLRISIRPVWKRSARYAQKNLLARNPFPSLGGLFGHPPSPWYTGPHAEIVLSNSDWVTKRRERQILSSQRGWQASEDASLFTLRIKPFERFLLLYLHKQ